MKRRLRLLISVCAFGLALGGLVHVRSLVVAEQYALGEALQAERKVRAEAVRLRERWERASDPARLRSRAEAELGMRTPSSEQVLR